MSFLSKPSLKERFTPTTIKLAEFYKSSNKGIKLQDNVLNKIKDTLRKSGISDAQIAQEITGNKPMSIGRAKEIIGKLNEAKIYGFERAPEKSIKTYLNKERVKAQTIASIRKEHILEAAEENLAKVGTTSLNQKAIGPSNSQGRPASIFGRRRHSSAVTSLTGKELTKTSSFTSKTGATNINRPGIGSGGSSGRGITIKPKF